MDWVKKIFRSTGDKQTPKEKVTEPQKGDGMSDSQSRAEKIALLTETLNQNWKQYDQHREDSRLHTLQFTFLELYDKLKVSFHIIKSKFRHIDSLAISSCNLLHNIYQSFVNDKKYKRKEAILKLFRYLHNNEHILKVILIFTHEFPSLDILLKSHLATCLVDIYLSMYNTNHKQVQEIFEKYKSTLQTMISILLQLCTNHLFVKNLIEADTLLHLFTRPLTQEEGLFILGETIIPVTSVIIKHGFTSEVVQYLKAKKLIPTACELLAEHMLVYDTSYLYDIILMFLSAIEESTKADAASNFLDEFGEWQGYNMLTQCLLLIEADASDLRCDKLIESIKDLAYLGNVDLPFEMDPENKFSPIEKIVNYNDITYKTTSGLIIQPATINVTTTKRVKNIKAYNVLQNYFLASSNNSMKEFVLESLSRLFCSHEENYFLLQPFRAVAHFIDSIPHQDTKVRDCIQQLVFVIATGLNVIPYYEILAFVNLFKDAMSVQNYDVSQLCVVSISFLVNYEPSLGAIFSEAGILTFLITQLRRYYQNLLVVDAKSEDSSLEIDQGFDCVMELIILFMNNDPEHITKLVRHNLKKMLPYFFKQTRTCQWGVKVVESIVMNSSRRRQDYFLYFLGHFVEIDEPFFVMHALDTLIILLDNVTSIQEFFRVNNGFEKVSLKLKLLENKFVEDEAQIEFYANIFTSLCHTIFNGIYESILSRMLITHKVISTLYDGIIQSNIHKVKDRLVISWLFKLVVEEKDNNILETTRYPSESEEEIEYFKDRIPIVYNPNFLSLLFDVIMEMDHRDHNFRHLFRIVEELLQKPSNLEAITSSNILERAIAFYNRNEPDSKALNEMMRKLIVTLLSYRTSPDAMHQFFAPLDPSACDVEILSDRMDVLNETFTSPRIFDAPFFSFDYSIQSLSSFVMKYSNIMWPPNNGFSLWFWVYFDQISSERLDVLCISRTGSKDPPVPMSMHLEDFQLHFQYNYNEKFFVPDFYFGCDKWYHVAVVHEKRMLATSETRVYIDGKLRQTRRENIQGATNTNVKLTLGNIDLSLYQDTTSIKPLWRLGNLFLIDQPLSAYDIYIINSLGSSYMNDFQGKIGDSFTYQSLNVHNILNIEGNNNITQHNLSFATLKTIVPIRDRIVIWLSPYKEYINFYHGLQEYSRDSFLTNQTLELKDANSLIAKDDRNQKLSVIELGSEEEQSKIKLNASSIHSSTLCWPAPLSNSMYQLQGVEILLFLLEYTSALEVEMEQPKESSLSCIVLKCLLEFSQKTPYNVIEMTRRNGYAIISEVMKRFRVLITPEKLAIMLEFIGIHPKSYMTKTEDDVPFKMNTSVLSNPHAFKHFFLDYSNWMRWPLDLQIQIFTSLQSLFIRNPCCKFNYSQMNKLNTFNVLINMLKDKNIKSELYHHIIHFMSNLMLASLQYSDVKQLANLIHFTFTNNSTIRPENLKKLRFLLISMTHKVLLKSDETAFCKCFNYKWMLLYFKLESDPRSIILMLHIFAVLSKRKPSYLDKFAKANGVKYLEKALLPFHNHADIYYILFCILLNTDSDVDLELNHQTSFIDLFPLRDDNFYSVVCKQIMYLILALVKQNFVNFLHNLEMRENEDLTFSLNTRHQDTMSMKASIRRQRSRSYAYRPSENKTPLKKTTIDQSQIQPRVKLAMIQPSLRDSFHSARATVGNVFRKAIKGRNRITKDVENVIIPCHLVRLHELNKPMIRQVPVFFKKRDLFSNTNTSNWREPESGSTLMKNVIIMVTRLFSHSPHMKDAIKKYRFMYYVTNILFPKNRFLQVHDLNFKMIESSFETLILNLIANILIDHIMMNSKEFVFDEILELSLPSSFTEYHEFNNVVLEYSFRLIANSLEANDGNDRSKIVQCLTRFCHYCIDKILVGTFTNGVEVLLQFLTKLMTWVDKIQFETKNELDLIMKAINRLTLVACIEIYNSQDMMAKAKTLSMIASHSNMILRQENMDRDFFVTFCHYMHTFIQIENNEISDYVQLIWKVLAYNKRDMVEWILKCTLEETISDTKNITLKFEDKSLKLFPYLMNNTAADLFDETQEKARKMVLTNEERVYRDQNNQVKKFRATIKQREEKHSKIDADLDTLVYHLQMAFSEMEEEEILSNQQFIDGWKDFNLYINKKWQDTRVVLFNELQLWGPKEDHPLQKWKLDDAENAYRMRMKLVRNYDFYKHYPYLPKSKENAIMYDIPQSKDSETFSKMTDQEREMVDKNLYYESRIVKISKQDKLHLESPYQRKYIHISRTSLDQDKARSLEQVDLGSDSETGMSISSQTSVDESKKMDSSVDESKKIELSVDESKKIDSSVAIPQKTQLSVDAPQKIELSADDSLNTETSDSELKVTETSDSELKMTDTSDSELKSTDTIVSEFTIIGTSDSELRTPNDTESRNLETNESYFSTDFSSSEEEFDMDMLSDFEHIQISQDANLDDDHLDQKLSRYLLPGDIPNYIVNASMVEGLDKVDGLFLLSRLCVYFIQNVSLIDDVIHFNMNQNEWKDYKTTRWYYTDLEKVLQRRYLLRPTAIEIFSRDFKSSLLVFDIHERGNVFSKIQESIQNSATYMVDLSLQECTDLWVQGKITNFDYLMKINTFAGRSYNDLTQYPVFPWILKDYESEELDLNDESIYRDLSLPMGALGEERRTKFIERYENLVDDEVPRFHYGSHYSSAAIVLHYLIRLEPYTQQFIKLQGGNFDHPDRLFYSIQGSWLSASEENMMDVKELIPEFFYLPDLFNNANRFLFGKTQNGEVIDHVQLPPWAHNDPQKFIAIHRKALESTYVSRNLHHWIDLIFGYKQKGQHAIDAVNVFYYLTYEGSVDIDKIENETIRESVIDQIHNFGQTPTQLFKRPHPRREHHNRIELPLFLNTADSLCIAFTKALSYPIGLISVPLNADSVLVLPPKKLILPFSGQKYISWDHNDMYLRIWDSKKLRLFCTTSYHPAAVVTNVSISSDGRLLTTSGSDNIIRLYKLEWIRKPKILCFHDIRFQGHSHPIIKVAVSRYLSIVVSLDLAGNVFVWDINTSTFIRSFKIDHQLGDVESLNPYGFVLIDSDDGKISVAMGYSLYVWGINGNLVGFTTCSEHGIITSLTAYSYTPHCKKQYVTGYVNGTIRVFDLIDESLKDWTDSQRNLKLRHELLAHAHPVTALTYSSRQRAFYSGDSSGKLIKWEEKRVY